MLVVFLTGALERTPSLIDDFDPERDGAFEDTWHDRLHIAYWEKWESFERDACQAMVDAFNKSQDEIYVHYVNTSQVDRKAMLAIMGGDPPEVIGLWANNVPHFAEAGALLCLDPFMQKAELLLSEEDFKKLLEAALKECNVAQPPENDGATEKEDLT